MTGSPEPILKNRFRIKGNNCNSVDSADMTSAAWIRMIESCSESPATPETMIGGVTQPTIIATTCWKANGVACFKSGTPFNSNKEARVVDLFMIVILLSYYFKLIRVPVVPLIPSFAFSSNVIKA